MSTSEPVAFGDFNTGAHYPNPDIDGIKEFCRKCAPAALRLFNERAPKPALHDDMSEQGDLIYARAAQLLRLRGTGRVLVDPETLGWLLHHVGVLATNPSYWETESSFAGRWPTVKYAHELAAALATVELAPSPAVATPADHEDRQERS